MTKIIHMKCNVKHKFCNNIVKCAVFADVVVTLTIFIPDIAKWVLYSEDPDEMRHKLINLSLAFGLPLTTFDIY